MTLDEDNTLAKALFEHIKHGDEKHQKWLREEIDAFFYSNPLAHRLAQPAVTDTWRRTTEKLQGELSDASAELAALRAPVTDAEVQACLTVPLIANATTRAQMQAVIRRLWARILVLSDAINNPLGWKANHADDLRQMAELRRELAAALAAKESP